MVHQIKLQVKMMTKKSERLEENIAIVGYKNVRIGNIKDFFDQFRKENKRVSIQFFDAKHVAGPQHLYFAALNALNAFKKKKNISNNLAVEALLYASAQRQIKKAVKMLGIKEDSSEVATLVITENEQKKSDYLCLVDKIIPGERDDSVLGLTAKKIGNITKVFGISDLEFESKLEKKGLEKVALTDLVIERIALLGTNS